jgi:hypothetical protein
MTTEEIKAIQRKVGVEADGIAGPKTKAAIQKHLKAILDKAPRRFPKVGTKEFKEFWGPHGVPDGYAPPMKKITLPFPLYLYGNKNKSVTTLSVHEKAAEAFAEFFANLAVKYPTQSERGAVGITVYDGLYNPRLMRGSSSTWSMHAWAIAIDLNAEENGLKTPWPSKAVMPLEVYECAAIAGLQSLGWTRGNDAMHISAENNL